MLGPADPKTHKTPAHEITPHLPPAARRPRAALTNSRDVALRQIPDFAAQSLPLPDRVVVTGGTGCIGTVLLQLLTEHGVAAVASISRRPPQGIRRVDGVRYLLADVRDLESLRRIFLAERPDLVIHLAGQRLPALAEQNVAETLSSNVFGTQAVLEAAAVTDVGRVVTASTGKALRFFASEIYAASKKLGEYLVSQAHEQWDISCTTARFTHVVDNSDVHRRLPPGGAPASRSACTPVASRSTPSQPSRRHSSWWQYLPRVHRSLPWRR